MFAYVLPRRGIILTILLMLQPMSGYAVRMSLSNLFTAAKAANQGGDSGFMNKYLLSDNNSDKNNDEAKAHAQDDEDLLEPVAIRTSSIGIVCPTAPPIFMVWVGSAPKFKHKQNMFDWYYHGHPVILWYHPEGLSELDKRKIRIIENVYSDPGTNEHRILVLNLDDAGLDSLSSTGFPITAMIKTLIKGAKRNPRLYATASNLARLALLVKGQEAITEAIAARNSTRYWGRAQIIPPEFHHTGVVYMDTDIYYEKAGELNLPHPSQSYGVHIFKDHDGRLRMNNDILYAQTAGQPDFADMLQKVIAKFEDAWARGAYNEYMEADPPHFNGAHFVRKQLSKNLEDEPAVYLDHEPQDTERNWHPKGGSYQNEFPTSSSD